MVGWLVFSWLLKGRVIDLIDVKNEKLPKRKIKEQYEQHQQTAKCLKNQQYQDNIINTSLIINICYMPH